MKQAVIALFTFIFSLFSFSKTIPTPGPSPSIRLSPSAIPSSPRAKYQTSCQTDKDCRLVDINDTNCCGRTGCEDLSTPNWVAANASWYKGVFQMSCNDGPCPLAQCNPKVVRETFVARCDNKKCVKLGGL